MKTVGDVLDRIEDLDRRLIAAVKRCDGERANAVQCMQEALRLENASTTESRLTLESAEDRKDKCNQARAVVAQARRKLHSSALDGEDTMALIQFLNEAESSLSQWGREPA